MPKPVGAFDAAAAAAAGIVFSWEHSAGADGDPFVATTAEIGGQSLAIGSGAGDYVSAVPADDVIGLDMSGLSVEASVTLPWGSGAATVYVRSRADWTTAPAAEGTSSIFFFAPDFSGGQRILDWNGSNYRIDNFGGSIDYPASMHDGTMRQAAVVIDWVAGTTTLYVDGVAVGSPISSVPGGSGSSWLLFFNSGAPRTGSTVRIYDSALTAGEIAAIAASPWADVGDAPAGDQEVSLEGSVVPSAVGTVSATLGTPQAVSLAGAAVPAAVGAVSASQAAIQAVTLGGAVVPSAVGSVSAELEAPQAVTLAGAVVPVVALGAGFPTRDDARVYAWGHSLVDWRYEGGPVFVERAQVGTGMSEIAVANGQTACFSGSYPTESLTPAFAGYESVAAGAWIDGHIHVPSCFGASWTASNFDVGTITDNNFTWQAGVEGPGNVGQTAAARTLINRIRSVAAPGFDIYLYSHWPPTDETIAPDDGFNAAGFAQWKLWLPGFASYYEALQDSINALLATNGDPAGIRLIPTTQVFEALFTGTGPLADWAFDEVFADGTHGTDSTYFLSGLVHYIAIYGRRPSNTFPVSLVANPTLDARLSSRWADIVDAAWTTITGDAALAARVYGAPVGGLTATLGTPQAVSLVGAAVPTAVGAVTADQTAIQAVTLGGAVVPTAVGAVSSALGTPQTVTLAGATVPTAAGAVVAALLGTEVVLGGSVVPTAVGGVSAALGAAQAVSLGGALVAAQVGSVSASQAPVVEAPIGPLRLSLPRVLGLALE